MSGPKRWFAGKGVVVTGAAQGIGWAVAEAFAAKRADVVLLDIDGDFLAATVDKIRASGGAAEAIAGDVSRREDVRRAVDVAVEGFGHLDVTDDSWNRILDVNLKGTWYLVQEAARARVRQGTGGAIAITSSTNAFQPEAGGLAYNTSKSGQVAVMHTAALELAKYGIRVNALAPGIINTRLSAFVINDPLQSRVFLARIPLRRFAEPEEMARPILWMCSDDASYLSGELMVVDGAMTAGLPEPGEMEAPLPGAIR
jgi:3-oxoacyl-[acyl-carrier protein] reductase